MQFDSSTPSIVAQLLNEANRLFEGGSTLTHFTGNPDADALINDLENYPHALVIACIMDRQIKAEKAWMIPLRLSERLGNFRFATLGALSLSEIERAMLEPEPLHRFPAEMSRNLHDAILRIAKHYNGDARRIWADSPSSALVVYRFLQFRGVGPKIATMATNILARDFRVQFSDYYSVDVSADVHVRRVFARLGLTREKPTVDEVIFRGRALYPEFPGKLDLPCWEIGRKWCHPAEPACHECTMANVCPTGLQRNTSRP